MLKEVPKQEGMKNDIKVGWCDDKICYIYYKKYPWSHMSERRLFCGQEKSDKYFFEMRIEGQIISQIILLYQIYHAKLEKLLLMILYK